MNNFIMAEKNDLKEIFGRFKRRDFSGNEGQIIKNSSYTLSSTIISKIGAFLFTIIIARMLLPELFGLYSLALSTILLFTLFSDLGTGTAMLTLVSKSLGKGNPQKAKTYFKKIYSYRIYLILLSATLLVISSKFIADNYYQKPIFLGLLAGALYITIISLQSYFSTIFFADNNFKYPMYKEIIFQISRIVIIPLAILLTIQSKNPSEIILAIILGLTLSYFMAFLFIRVSAKKNISFLKEKEESLTTEDKKRLKKFILPLSVMAFSGLFFGYIDTLMLGHYVDSIFIGYYGASLGLIGAAMAIIGFLPGAILPIFSRLDGRALEKSFRKIFLITLLISIAAAIFTFFVARYVLLIYGESYLPAIPILKILSLLILITPLTGLYDVYFTSREKTLTIAKLLIFSTILNIFLNWFFITQGLKYGMMAAVIGACIATIISKFFYLVGIGFKK